MTKTNKDFFVFQNGFSDEFLQKTKTLFESVIGKELSQEECREIAENLIGLELYLRRLKKKYEIQP
jgi:hypothetical protein